MNKKLLLVDDSRTILLQEQVILRRSYDLVTASNGREALAAALSEKPDLVVMDVVMPVMDGLEACRAFRGDPRTSTLPIILVTSRGEPQSRAAGFESGCTDYLTKPINPVDLLARISENLDGAQPQARRPVESARARVLREYQILDTPAEDAFDDLARLALQVTGAAVAMVSFVDGERLFVKAIAGTARGDEIARHRFPCDRVVSAGASLFIENLAAEAALRDHPFLRRHNLQSYAGIPLVPPAEVAVGALGVFDRKVRTFTPLEQDALSTVARQVITQMDVRRSAIRDPLTGVFNRRYMDETLPRELRRADRLAVPVGLSLIELDTKDQAILGEAGALLQARTRQEDIVCRHEANVFAVILPSAAADANRRRAGELAEIIRALRVPVALGTAVYPQDGGEAATLLRVARASLEGSRGRR
jgi:diguanylate cyclase (GGDEF)-like protein